MTASFTTALTPSASSARAARLKQDASAKIAINRKNFIKFVCILTTANVGSSAAVTALGLFKKYISAPRNAAKASPTMMDQVKINLCLRRNAAPPCPGSR